VPEGKNHGFILYLDMSGSMAQHMYDTIQQLLLLTTFAKQIQVPFRVYGFTNARVVEEWKIRTDEHCTKVAQERLEKGRVENDVVQGHHALLELFSDKMRKNEFSWMASSLLGHFMSRNGNWKERKKWFNTFNNNMYISLDDIFGLGGTPLDSAIMSGIKLARDFRKAHQIDALHTFFLTDGASHPPLTVNENGTEYESYVPSSRGYHGYEKVRATFASGNTGKDYWMKTYEDDRYLRHGTTTDVLLRMYADETGSSVIGYRLEENRKSQVVNTREYMTGKRQNWNAQNEMMKVYRKNGYMKLRNAIGYDEAYIISTSSLKTVDNKLDHLLEGTSKARIKSAFKSANIGSKKSRKMLTDLVERIA
jgi:hypothetical protein